MTWFLLCDHNGTTKFLWPFVYKKTSIGKWATQTNITVYKILLESVLFTSLDKFYGQKSPLMCIFHFGGDLPHSGILASMTVETTVAEMLNPLLVVPYLISFYYFKTNWWFSARRYVLLCWNVSIWVKAVGKYWTNYNFFVCSCDWSTDIVKIIF